MRIVFFGSSEFAVLFLEVLRDSEELCLVVTRPDRKKGRSLKIASTAVKESADRAGVKTYQPRDVNGEECLARLKEERADLFVVVSFGQILSRKVLDIPGMYCVNAHASLLPKYRGAAPINRAIANGEKETGVTLIRMNEGMDRGDIIAETRVDIGTRDDAVSLSRKLASEGATLLKRSLNPMREGSVDFRRQNDAEATYAPKLTKEDGVINWSWDADKICNRIRGFVPWPGCFTRLDGKILKIWKAVPVSDSYGTELSEGSVLKAEKESFLVLAGKGSVRIDELQLEGKRRMQAKEFIKGHKGLRRGTKLGYNKN